VVAEQTSHYDLASSLDDDALLARARMGDNSAFSTLFVRYYEAARNLAASLTRAVDAEDVTAEAFSRVFASIRKGKGPSDNFRAYLLRTVRRQVIDLAVVARREVASTDDFESITPAVAAADANPTTVDELRRALERLPATWRMVLWKIEVEGLKPRDLARDLETTPAAASAIVYRAREGLREAYLHGHVEPVAERECQIVSDLLAGYVRSSVTARQRRIVTTHLEACAECAARRDRLTSVNRNFDQAAVGSSLAAIGPAGVLGFAALAKWLLAPAAASHGAGLGAAVQQAIGAKAVIAAGTAATVIAVSGAVYVAEQPGSSPAVTAAPDLGVNGRISANSADRLPSVGLTTSPGESDRFQGAVSLVMPKPGSTAKKVTGTTTADTKSTKKRAAGKGTQKSSTTKRSGQSHGRSGTSAARGTWGRGNPGATAATRTPNPDAIAAAAKRSTPGAHRADPPRRQHIARHSVTTPPTGTGGNQVDPTTEPTVAPTPVSTVTAVDQPATVTPLAKTTPSLPPLAN
jgi:RNA polymerase sigma factor (sigma-70 family)